MPEQNWNIAPGMLYVDNRGIAGRRGTGERIGSVSRWSHRVLKAIPALRRTAERPDQSVFSRVESGDGRKREQGHSGRQSRQGSGNPADPGRAADRQSEHRDLRNLARQGHRRAQGKDRMAPRGDLQRRALQDRRAVSEEGRQGLYRRPVADPQMDRPERRREILDRSGAAGLQLDPAALHSEVF